MARYIGKEMSRVDGVAKVTGKAKYAAEFQVPNVAYGFIVTGTVAKGTITTIDTREAEARRGVIRVFTHLNTPKLGPKAADGGGAAAGRARSRTSRSARCSPTGSSSTRQPVALVVAETYEQARYAARLVKVTYNAEQHATDTEAVRERARVPPKAPPPKPRGNPEEAMRSAPVKIEAEYRIPIEHHNPMEPHAAIAFWQGDKLTIFDKTQDVYSVRDAPGFELRRARGERERHLAVRRRRVRLVAAAELLSGADGHGGARAQAPGEGRLHAHADVHRPRLPAVHDPEGRARRGAVREALRDDPRGRAQHLVASRSSPTTRPVSRARSTPARTSTRRSRSPTPTSTRRPGCARRARSAACSRSNARWTSWPTRSRSIRSSCASSTTPRRIPESGKPFSSKALRECYRLGAEKFGWKDRKFEPRSMRDGRLLVGWGMATGVWGAFQMPASARITLARRRHRARRQRDQRHRPRHLHRDDHDRRRVPRAASRSR